MYIKIRRLGDNVKSEDLLINISKKAKIEDLRSIIYKEIGISTDRQRLFYRGKQLVDDHCLVEYDIHLNDVIQLMVKAEISQTDTKIEEHAGSSRNIPEEECDSKLFKRGDNVDMRDMHGAWFEGKITKITKKVSDAEESDLIFYVQRLSELQRAPCEVNFSDIRPRSYSVLDLTDIKINDIVLVNYNIDDSKSRGYWYDCKITNKTDKTVTGTVLFGTEKTPIDDCQIVFVDEIFRIENVNQTGENDIIDYSKVPLRKIPYNCLKCKDHPTRKCKECGCQVCFGKNNWEEILLCDECDDGYHIGCLTPPLKEIPQEDEWYCPKCKTDENEIVKAGDKLKFSKKRAKMPSANEKANGPDWGRGMACVGPTKECTIVSKNHLGPIPGVEVGTCWKFRFQVYFSVIDSFL